MPTTHDPYLDTVRRSLNDEKIKLRKHRVKKTDKKSFLSQNIILRDYIYLPEGLQNLFLLATFFLIPYGFGLFILFIVKFNEFSQFIKFNFDMFMLTWTIGYETLAALLLLAIIKSAFSFKREMN